MSLINGTNQNDTLVGTSEDDKIFGSNGDDSLDGLGGNDRIDGGNGNDTLQGRDGNDTLKGGNGNDRLYAGKGQDILTGGNGDDTFVIGRTGSSTLAGADSITDFGRGKDLIELTNGLSFNNLNVSQGTETFARDTVITDKVTGQVLAVLQEVNSSTIDSTDFISTPSSAKGYTFTKIADTSGAFSSFDDPAINDLGTVVFKAREDDGSEGIFTGSGGATTTIAETDGSFSGFPVGEPEINNSGTVVFSAFPAEGGVGIFSNSGGTTTTIVSGQDYGFQDVDINDLGTIAFSGALEGGGITSLYFVKDGVTTKIAGPNSPISSIEGSQINNVYNLDINESDSVVFRAATDSSNVGIFTISNGVATKISDTSNGGIAINDAGTVVFDRGDSIFINENGVTNTFVDTSGSFNSVQSPVINNNDTVVFAGQLDEDAGTYDYGIFTGSDSINDKVIAPGDTINGSTVQFIDPILSDNGLNNLDQIVFTATFTDGTEAIYRAEPITLGQGVGASSDPFGIDARMYNDEMMQLNNPIISNSQGTL